MPGGGGGRAPGGGPPSRRKRVDTRSRPGLKWTGERRVDRRRGDDPVRPAPREPPGPHRRGGPGRHARRRHRAARRPVHDAGVERPDALVVAAMNPEEFTGEGNYGSLIATRLGLSYVPALRGETATSSGAAAGRPPPA